MSSMVSLVPMDKAVAADESGGRADNTMAGGADF